MGKNMRISRSKSLILVAILFGICVASIQAQLVKVDVGSNPIGTMTSNGPGSFTIVGGGDDIWSDQDNFTFGQYDQTGDFDVRVRVEYLQPNARWSKAGIMAREDNVPVSRMAFSRVTPAA